MDAIAIRRGADAPELIDRPRPVPGAGEALVRTLRVGIDGTDHEVVAGNHGAVPDGEEYLVLGHEAVGIVEDPNGTDLDAGTVVAPTVRRPPAGTPNDYFQRGAADMAPPDATLECGIDGAHGFMAEFFTAPEEYLVELPDSLAEYGFLAEPASVTEKALEHAYASRSAFDWRPESACVLGNGSLGLLTLAMLGGYDRTYCVGRRDRPDPTIEFVESLGATYVDSRATPVDDLADAHEPMDLVYEATGYARHPFASIEALAPGGVAALLGVPDPWTFEIDGGRLHEELVMNNKALVGSVNAGREHFAAAADRLVDLPTTVFEDLVTDVHRVEEFERAFADDETTIKAAVEFHH